MMMSLDTDEGSDNESLDKPVVKSEDIVAKDDGDTDIPVAERKSQPTSGVVPQSLEASSLPGLSINLSAVKVCS